MKKSIVAAAVLLLMIGPVKTQDIEVSFNGGGTVIDSVIATNLTSGESVQLPGDATLILRRGTTGMNHVPFEENRVLVMNRSDNELFLNYSSPEQQDIIIRICDISGKILTQKGIQAQQGINQYILSTRTDGIHLITIMAQEGCYSMKGILQGKGTNEIRFAGNLGMNPVHPTLKSSQGDSYILVFSTGDIVSYQFHSGKSITFINEEAGASSVLSPEFHECVDYEGNSYSVVKVGNQWWMAENLKSTRYSDGTEVYLLEDDDLWSHLLFNEKACCFYDNEESLGYGTLYTYGAAVNGIPNRGTYESTGICPHGWHLPGDTEWMELQNYLIDHGYNWDGTTTDNKIGKSLASTSGWVENEFIDGYVGNNQGSNNRTGFNARPFGSRSAENGLFLDEGYEGTWWSSSEHSDLSAYKWNLSTSLASLNHHHNYKTTGYSVRCIKNSHESVFANFSADKTEVAIGEEVRFTDLSTEEATRWFWDFGDCSTSWEQNPVHIYSSPGSYSVHVSFLIDGHSREETKTDFITVSERGSGTVADYEGNVYKTVIIGDQLWMAENLESTRYGDGTGIPLVSGDAEWGSLAADNAAKAYCFYDNDEHSGFGALYTYAAAVNGSPYDGTGHVQGICPDGWHIPAETEWNDMENYLISNGYNYDGSTLGNKIGKSLASTGGWNNSTAEGAVGNNQGLNNSSGFTGLPGGYRSYYSTTGEFAGSGDGGYWWMANDVFEETAMFWNLYFDYKHVLRDYTFKRTGLSVRCLKNNDGSPLADFSSNVAEVKLGGVVSFTDLSSNSPTSWTWNFDSPGETSVEQHPSHRFTRRGFQRVTLIASNDIGYDVETKPDYINVTQRTGLVNDVDGNIYRTIEIGDQWWMAENLRTTRLRDGTEIPLVPDDISLIESTSPGYRWYEDDRATYGETYGALYNWYTISTENLCPAGWHVPTDEDWKVLESALGMSSSETDSMFIRGTFEGSKLAGGEDLWVYHASPTNIDFISHDHFGSSGFEALPGGSFKQCAWSGEPYCFYGDGGSGKFWSITESDTHRAWGREIAIYTTGVIRVYEPKSNGLSVRCVQD